MQFRIRHLYLGHVRFHPDGQQIAFLCRVADTKTYVGLNFLE